MKSRNVFVSWTQRFCFSIAEEKWGNQYICFLNKDLSLKAQHEICCTLLGLSFDMFYILGVIFKGCSSKIIKLLQQHASTWERVHLSAISLELGDFKFNMCFLLKLHFYNSDTLFEMNQGTFGASCQILQPLHRKGVSSQTTLSWPLAEKSS